MLNLGTFFSELMQIYAVIQVVSSLKIMAAFVLLFLDIKLLLTEYIAIHNNEQE